MQSLSSFFETTASTNSQLDKSQFGSGAVSGGLFPYQSLRLKRIGRNPSSGERSVSNYGMQMRFLTQHIERGLTPDLSNI